MRPLILLALITPSARSCFDTTRGGCFTAGFVDNLSSADDCQAACAFDSACNYFAYHSARGDRRSTGGKSNTKKGPCNYE